MLKYKPLNKIEPSDFGFGNVYFFFDNYSVDIKTGLVIKRWIEIWDKKGGKVIDTKEFSSEKEEKEFINTNLMNGTLILDDKRLCHA